MYVSTKLAAELLVHSYREMYGQQFTILRYGIPYGPRMRDVLVVARFVRAALEGRPITIAGTGEQQRNYVYVEDLADAHVRALAPAAAGQVLALEGGTPVSVREIADTVQQLIGRGAGRAHARPHCRLPGRERLQPAGQGTARLVAGDPVRGRGPPLPRLARRGREAARAAGVTAGTGGPAGRP